MKKGNKCLTLEDRLLIEKMLKTGKSAIDIADRLGVTVPTIHREKKRGEVDGEYSAEYAEKETKAKRQHCGSISFFKKHPKIGLYLEKRILEDGAGLIEIEKNLKEMYPKEQVPSRQTMYKAIDDGLIPNVTRENLKHNYTNVFSNGLLRFPNEFRKQCNIKDGDKFYFQQLPDGKILLERKTD